MTSKPHAMPRRMPPRRRAGERLASASAMGAAARLVLSLGPATVLAGFVWALLQPYRVTLLDPNGQSFWWLVAEPPLLVILAGVLFHVAVARGLVTDMLESDQPREGDP